MLFKTTNELVYPLSYGQATFLMMPGNRHFAALLFRQLTTEFNFLCFLVPAHDNALIG
jgi:hypothetical protein